MPKLIIVNRRLGVVARHLVTDAGGAPCCCGGEPEPCCDPAWLCGPRYVSQCVGGQFLPAYCRDAKAMTETVLLRVASRHTVSVSDGYRLFAAVSAQWAFRLCRPTNQGMTITPLSLNGFISIDESRNGSELYRFDAGGDLFAEDAVDSSRWVVQYQTPGRGPTVLSFQFPNFPANRQTFAGANVQATGTAPIVGAGNFPAVSGAIGAAFVSVGTACSGSNRQDFADGYRLTTWDAADSCDGPASLMSRVESAQDYTQRGLRITESEFTEYQLSASRTWCACDGTGPSELAGGCSNCGDRSTLEPFA